MALSDEQIQDLQKVVLLWTYTEKVGQIMALPFEDEETRTTYLIFHKLKTELTQAILFVPVFWENQPNYQEAALVIAGTNPLSLKAMLSAIRGIEKLTQQTQEVRAFYRDCLRLLTDVNGKITNISGFSQSAPAAAKIGAEMRISRITNFMDWGGSAALRTFKNPQGISDEEVTYLNQHARIYVDSLKDVIRLDGNWGRIPYGNILMVEGRHFNGPIADHNPAFPIIAGNRLNIAKYLQKGHFCSGMTKAEVLKVARQKSLIQHPILDAIYLKKYRAIYGPFANKAPKYKTRKSL